MHHNAADGFGSISTKETSSEPACRSAPRLASCGSHAASWNCFLVVRIGVILFAMCVFLKVGGLLFENGTRLHFGFLFESNQRGPVFGRRWLPLLLLKRVPIALHCSPWFYHDMIMARLEGWPNLFDVQVSIAETTTIFGPKFKRQGADCLTGR